MYEKFYQLGSVCGDRGSVWSAKHKSNPGQYAVKIYNLDHCQEEFGKLQHEIKTVRQLNHKNVIKYLSIFITGQELWIAMPLHGFTSVSRVVVAHFRDGLPEPALCWVIKDVLIALQYIHSKGIIHRSIKGSHILIDAHGHCILSGFRHSMDAISQGKWEKPIHSYPDEAAFNLNWSSPELLRQDVEGYCEKTDIYSLGITACELGNGEIPYAKLDPQLMMVEKFFGREPFLYDANTCRIFSGNGKDSGVGGSYADYLVSLPKMTDKYFTPAAHQFVASCLIANQDVRPSAEKLFTHQFIKQSRKIPLTLSQLLHPVTPINEETDFIGSNTDLHRNGEDEGKSSLEDDFSWDFINSA